MLKLFLSIQISSAQTYVEDFSNGIPTDWTTYTEAAFDFVTDFEGEVNLFKQSEGEQVLMLLTPSFDLSLISKLEIDVYGFNLSFVDPSIPEFHVGYLLDSNDPLSFEPIQVQYISIVPVLH